MNKSIFKPILSGIFIGALVFLMPFFILKVIAFFMIASLMFRIFIGRRMGRGMHNYKLAFADRVRNMNEDEYNEFKSKVGNGCHPYHHNQNENK